MKDIDFYQPQEPFFGKTISKYEPNSTKENVHLVISGFPYDEGTKINGGRIGGAIASTIFRKTLQQTQLYAHQNIQVFDSGDISNQLALEDAHEELFKKNFTLLTQNKNRVLFAIGGSNDQSYPNARSLMEAFPDSKLLVINIDSHFDVRPKKDGKAHSGSPFRLMLENEKFDKNGSKFVEFGCKGAACSKQHQKYLKGKGAQIYWLEKDIRLFQSKKNSEYSTQAGQLFSQIIANFQQEVDFIFVSFDVDAINCKWMPGVSAPSVIGGLTAEQACQIMKISGKTKKIKLVDCSEFNPAVEAQLSSRVIVEMFYNLVMSLGERA